MSKTGLGALSTNKLDKLYAKITKAAEKGREAEVQTGLIVATGPGDPRAPVSNPRPTCGGARGCGAARPSGRAARRGPSTCCTRRRSP